MDNKMDDQELISALADGQLRGDAFGRAVQAVASDARSRQAWHAYHVVGEVLRTGRAAPALSAPDEFLARLQQRLRQEPQIAAQAAPVGAGRQPAANDWRWKLVAGVASVAAVAAVGWNMWGAAGTAGAGPQLAAAPGAVVPVSAEASPMARDPRLDQLLQAHRQLGGGTALGPTSGFLRNATFEGPAR